MSLKEYKRKRRFDETPEPPPKLEARPGHRFVVQKHRATRLHYDFRLEMEGVLKSWAVPKGPSLDPADKRLAMMVEDHPVSYFDFEGVIPPGNYGAGTVMVWDTGTWEPLGDAAAMLEKGDLKFRLHGEKLNGDFVLAHMKSRRPGSKGTEWLLIKHRDQAVVPGYDIDKYDYSVLTQRSLAEIAGDKGSAEWLSSRKASRGGGHTRKNAWLDEALAKAKASKGAAPKTKAPRSRSAPKARKSTQTASSPQEEDTHGAIAGSELSSLPGAERALMPRRIYPMLATLVDEPFDSNDWLFEVKWDGYRAIAFLEDSKLRFVSRNQNEYSRFTDLRDMPSYISAQSAVIDGEIVALDGEGRPSFSLMQERLSNPGDKSQARIPIVYYAFDLIYLDGYSLVRVDLERRKALLRGVLGPAPSLRYSEHYIGEGVALYNAARQQNLEGIVAKRRNSRYLEKRTRDWLKIKITNSQECVIGGYTDPRGSREHFGSLVLGLYNDKDQLIPVGQAGSGFTQKTHEEMWQRLKKLETSASPFAEKPDSPRRVHFVKPVLIAQIKFTEWTHEGKSGSMRMRAPIYMGLRSDKDPKECRFELPKPTGREIEVS